MVCGLMTEPRAQGASTSTSVLRMLPTGTSVAPPFFDVNGNGSFTDDNVVVGGVSIPVGSVDLGIAMPTTPTIIENLLVAGGSLGSTGSVGVNNPANQGRISWREIVGD